MADQRHMDEDFALAGGGLLLAALGCGDDAAAVTRQRGRGRAGQRQRRVTRNEGRRQRRSNAGSGGTIGGRIDAATTRVTEATGRLDAHDAGGRDEDAGGGGPSWSDDVHPALVAGCGGCHGEPSDNDGGGIVIGRPGGPGEGTATHRASSR